MKHKIIILLFIFTISCNLQYPEYSAKLSFNESIEYVHYNIQQKKELPAADIWQLPETTMDMGTGDCEDIAGLIIYLSGEGNFCIGILYHSDYGELANHAAVKYENNYYDYNGLIDNNYIFQKRYELTFQQYINRCHQ